MPWEIKRKGDQFCVHKKDGDEVSCHPSEEQAKTHMRALYANESKEITELLDALDADLAFSPPLSSDNKEAEEKCYEPYSWRPYLGATSFAEMESYEETRKKANVVQSVNYQFRELMDNIIRDEDIEDKAAAMNTLISEYQERLSKAKGPNFMDLIKEGLFGSSENKEETDLTTLAKAAIKRENGLDFPARDYAYAPDPAKPATWQVRLTEAPGKITLAQLQRAAVLLSNVKSLPIPPAALNAVKRRIRAEFRKLGVADAQLPPSIREGTVVARVKEQTPAANSFSVWKDATTGKYHWMAVYSNNFRDDDNPPEIISEKSHKAFTYLANEGILPMPELWHWHVPGSRWGIAKQLDYVDGFAIAIGDVDPGFESHAETLSQRDDLGVSHGMLRKNIQRNPEDPSCIDFHATYEISDLPLSKAANKHTGFFVIKEENDDMPFAPDKKEYLKGLGYSDENIAKMESTLLGASKNLQQAGVESKEETPAGTDAEESKEEKPITRAEIVQALADTVGPLVMYAQNLEISNTELKARVDALEAQVKELSVADATKIAKSAEATPAASLSEMMASHLTKSNQIAANSTLLKTAAKETEDAAPSRTPSGFLNTVIAKSHAPA